MKLNNLRLILFLFVISCAHTGQVDNFRKPGQQIDRSTCYSLFNELIDHHQLELEDSPFGLGKALKYTASDSASIDITNLNDGKVMSLNTLNLHFYKGKVKRNSDGSFMRDPDTNEFIYHKQPSEKNVEHKKELGKIFEEERPHIALLQEVEGDEALHRFIKNHLASKYVPLMIKGNDSRGIDVAVLLHKDLNVYAELHSFKEFKGQYQGNERAVFSRDYPVVLVWKGGAVSEHDPPLFAIGVRHHKSMRDRDGDPNSTMLRKLEVETGEKIHQLLYQKYGTNLPVFIAGDFNNTVNDLVRAPEFQPMHDAGFRDVMDIAETPPSGSRVTHTYHPHDGDTDASQIDSIQANQAAQSLNAVKSAGVYRYKDAQGNPKPIPETYDQRQENPSDHFPIWATIDFSKISSSRGE